MMTSRGARSRDPAKKYKSRRLQNIFESSSSFNVPTPSFFCSILRIFGLLPLRSSFPPCSSPPCELRLGAFCHLELSSTQPPRDGFLAQLHPRRSRGVGKAALQDGQSLLEESTITIRAMCLRKSRKVFYIGSSLWEEC